MAIRTIGLFGGGGRPGGEVAAAVALIRSRCAAAGVRLLVAAELADAAGPEPAGTPADEVVREADLVVALGGDGTMLQAAREIGTSRTPLLGINLGSLGYLTDVPHDELGAALDRLFAGDYYLSERYRVSAVAWRDGRPLATLSALNDIVVNMGPRPRALDMEVRIDDASLSRFLGDGLIVSTPTGSTAYNLAAGGPICHPAVAALLVTPICPHSLAMRPLIVPNEKDIELQLHEVGDGATLTADGRQAVSLQSGDRVVYRLADDWVYLVKFPLSNFFEVMRCKLNYGAPPRRGRS
jgi:NAD+ kinase